MFRISPELKEEVGRKAEENDTTMTNYIEYLIRKDLEENPIVKKRRILLGTSSTGQRKKFKLLRKLS